MSRRWTNFIRGPNLHDQPEQYTEESSKKLPVSKLSEEEGARIHRDYEEIINQPSTSKVNSHHLRSKSRSEAAQPIVVKPLPAFSQLQKLAEENNSDELKSVLRIHSVDLNQTDEFGWTLLMVAACAGATETVSLLLESGADLRVKNQKGLTAYALAEKKHFKQVCEVIFNWRGKLKRESFVSSEEEQKGKSESSAGYCDSCQAEYSCYLKHSRSIAHLISTSDNTGTRTHYGIPESNKGFQLLLKHGWDRERGLGPEGEGQKFPVKTVLKRDRIGLGSEGEKCKARVTHFGPGDVAAVKREVKTGERLERKRTIEKKAEVKRKTKETRKEINFRRDLESL